MVDGDWDDLWAAGMGGGSPYGWVVLSEAERTPLSVKYEMLSVRDEPGWLLAERSTPADEFETEPVEIKLSAKLRRFGDPDLEAAMLTAIAQRLRELQGDTISVLPIREFAVTRPSKGED